MPDTDFYPIGLPRTEPLEDPRAYMQAALQWHFGQATGSPYWLKRARALDLNSLTDVKTFEDLTLFPNVVDELRDTNVAEERQFHGFFGNRRTISSAMNSSVASRGLFTDRPVCVCRRRSRCRTVLG